ncbi:MAG: Rha family transcriptional regulator, partial [Xanthomonas perforans]|nr:Rha family transcriptional regulator [Xanthomonas perforans]
MNDLTITGNTLTMSSREIAELTGKQHKHVIRDIRAMLEELSEDGPVLGHVEVKDARGYTDCFSLNRDLTETLITGYSIAL